MGFVLSKFRKEKSTEAVLEGLQTKIQALEKYMINTEERKRRFVTNFVGFTIGLYIVGFGLWYFFYFPPTLQECLMYLVPLLLFPIVIILLRRLFTWYFQRKLNKNGDKLARLKEDKRVLLEQVMDKETYKVALNLLERFGDKKQLRLGSGLQTPNRHSLAQRSPQTAARAAAIGQPQQQQQQQQQRSLAPYTSVYRNNNNNSSASLNSSVISPHSLAVTSATSQVPAVQELRRRTPFPIVDERSRSAVDRIVDFIVGDSPQNRFGMICKECHAHNGMLPKEEYEYASFRCAFCNTLNQARKKRPVAPRLSVEAPTPASARRNESSESESSDDEESDNQPSVRRVLLQDVPSGEGELDATTVTEDLEAEERELETEMETETPETGSTADTAAATAAAAAVDVSQAEETATASS